jgi:hypothetical protein
LAVLRALYFCRHYSKQKQTTMDGLTIEQEQEYTRDIKVRTYLGMHQSVVDGYLPLKNKQTAFGDHIGELETLVTGKVIDSKGQTVTKADKKEAVGVYYEGICGVCRQFFLDKGDKLMAGNFNVTKSKVIHLKDGNVLPLVTQLNTWITDLLIPDPAFADYDVDAGDLTAGAGLAADFVAAMEVTPAIESDKSAAGEDVEAKVDVLRSDITSLDLLVKRFITSNVSFYNGFQNAKVIDDIGVHHSGIKGEVTKAGEPVDDAIIKCVELNKEAHSNLLGHYEIVPMKPGLHKFICSSPTAGTQAKVIQVKKGKTIEVDWNLSQSTGGGTNTIVRDGDLAPGARTTVNTDDIETTSATTITILCTANCDIYGSNAVDGVPGSPSLIHALANTPITLTASEFESNAGLDSGHPNLVVLNTTPGIAHYSLTFQDVV